MRQAWDDYEKASDHGPLRVATKAVIGLFVLAALIGGLGYAFGWFHDAAGVVKDEFGPRAALGKYSWFKDAAAQLEKKQADISVYQGRLTAMGATYNGAPRREWAREDREQYNVWSSEVAGVKGSYNSLAAEYNSQMAKFNWRFANVGELPRGADRPLPREFKEYIEQ